MEDWKQKAIDAYERACEETELQEAEHKAFRVEQAKEKLIAALQELNIPLPAEAEIRVEDHEDDAELGAIPYVTIDGTEFTLGPNRSQEHGGGLGIVTACPRCHVLWRGPYLYDQHILGRELLNPSRIAHPCQTEEEKQEAALLESQIAEATPATDSPEHQLLDALRDVIDDRIQERTGA